MNKKTQEEKSRNREKAVYVKPRVKTEPVLERQVLGTGLAGPPQC